MKLSGDLTFKLMVSGLVLGGVVFFVWRGYKGLSDMVPQKVKDGTQAAVQLGKLGVNIITDPLDAMGIVPAWNDLRSSTNWERNLPWTDAIYDPKTYGKSDAPNVSNDPVSNNDSGVNYNLF